MKQANNKTNNNSRWIIILVVIGAVVISYSTYAYFTGIIDAREKALEFCNKFNSDCNQYETSTSVLLLKSGRMGRWEGIKETSHGDVAVRLESKRAYDSAGISLVIGRRSKEVELYNNDDLYWSIRRKYKYEDGNMGNLYWPEFMPEAKAKIIVETLQSKLAIPPDMVLYEMIKNAKNGVWNVVFWREKDGYRYEHDSISIIIMGATGEFVGYTKKYEGTPCPTDVKINKEEVVELGWQRLRNKLANDLGTKAKDIYSVSSNLRIIQPYSFSKESRLAWIVRYGYTGGIEVVEKEKYSREEIDQKAERIGERERKWREMGRPPRFYEIKVDAATGDILYTSTLMPQFLRWLIK